MFDGSNRSRDHRAAGQVPRRVSEALLPKRGAVRRLSTGLLWPEKGKNAFHPLETIVEAAGLSL